ncbi:MAG: acylphosphatase [Candidatus Omnitrophota bacterium]
MDFKRVHVFYSGNVQGVGFRYTASDIASAIGVTGWVKNLRDGRVEIVAEAEEGLLKEFLDRIENGQLGSYIRDVDLSWGKPEKEFTAFDIEF